ncbi:MAG: C45 family autoproteolytic acyltransferase/hydrolase [Planctomycetota bacterium]
MSRRTPRSSPLAAWLLVAGVAFAQAPAAPAAPAVHGRIEDLGGGLRLLRLWGTPAERGYAHGFLLGKEIAAGAVAEFEHRFGVRKDLLELARSAVGRVVAYPDDVGAEIDALFAGLTASAVDLQMPALGRAFDLVDLRVANALDVFGLMGCSGFTVWGDEVVGGGVLTARNFDWPLTGEHLLTNTMLVVQHRPDAAATASVTWPGYVATVTGVSSEGVAAFLHVGTGKITYTPEAESWPTAVAARCILEQLRADAPAAASFGKARELLSNTSPPAGFLTRVVLATVPAGGAPVGVFETDHRKSVLADGPAEFSVVTNHFHTRKDGREASKDSLGREQQLCDGVAGCLREGDDKVSVEEAWQLLAKVQRGGRRGFGTLHALVFRNAPWCFELRIATMDGKQIVPATASQRRFALTREQLFGTGDPAGAASGSSR